MSLNAFILYKNQEICNNTNLWKFQLISLFFLWENSKDAFSIFVFILMAGVFVSWDENSLLDLISLIIRKLRKLSTIVIFIPCKLCVNLWTFLFLPILCRGFNQLSCSIFVNLIIFLSQFYVIYCEFSKCICMYTSCHWIMYAIKYKKLKDNKM